MNALVHLMGTPDETHLIVRNEQAVVAPSWSTHSGCGARAYSFIRGMQRARRSGEMRGDGNYPGPLPASLSNPLSVAIDARGALYITVPNAVLKAVH